MENTNLTDNILKILAKRFNNNDEILVKLVTQLFLKELFKSIKEELIADIVKSLTDVNSENDLELVLKSYNIDPQQLYSEITNQYSTIVKEYIKSYPTSPK